MRLLGSLYLTAAASIWGGMYVVTKYVLDYIPPLTLLVMRLVIAGVIFGGVALARGGWRVRLRDLWLLGALGVIGFTCSLGLQFWGTKLSSAHNGGLITSVSPAFIVLFARWVLRERLTWRSAVSLGLATAGVLAVIGPESGGSGGGSGGLWLGNLCLLGAAVTWALYTVMGKLASLSHISLTVSLYATLSGILCTIPVAWAGEWHRAAWSPAGVPALAWWGVAYVGVISTAVAFYLWVKGFSLLDAGPASLFFFAQPLVAAVLGAVLLHESLHWYFVLGAGLIAAGMLVSAGGNTEARRKGVPVHD